MNVTFIVLTYERPRILQTCLQTLFLNTEIRPVETWILDDGSSPPLQDALLKLSQDHRLKGNTINLILGGRNYGIGYNFERAYNIMRQSDSDIVAFIESDYIWRKGYLEDVLAVFEASPWTVAIAGVDHPDMYLREKTHRTFVDLMKEQFGKDLGARDSLYIPFDLDTRLGKIKVQGVSNSCGCQLVHWGRLKQLLDDEDLEKEYWKWMDRAFHKNGTGDRRLASDAHMSGTLSFFSEKWMKRFGVDITKNFGMLSIIPSISSHICGGGINGMIVGEGETFVVSPTWRDEYLTKNPRS